MPILMLAHICPNKLVANITIFNDTSKNSCNKKL